MLKATNIHKSYDDLHVLKGVDIEVNQGELISIIGKSGSGKSTLLHILGSLDIPDQGQVLINGENIFNKKEKELSTFRNLHIGFVFQFHHLLAEFDALENVKIPGLIQKKESSVLETKAKELLDYLGLKDRMSHKPGQLSGGEQQRVAIARALINDPQIIFADEPTGNLDKTSSDELHQLFFQLKKDFNQTFVLVTHNMELANLSDRTLEMVDGNIR